MSGTDYWLRQQISLAQWRDFHKEAERERQVELALNGQVQPTWVSRLQSALGQTLLSLATWLIRDIPQPGLHPKRFESCPGH
jgi:hypothetical protein